jgi:hypothetical protein
MINMDIGEVREKSSSPLLSLEFNKSPLKLTAQKMTEAKQTNQIPSPSSPGISESQ